MSDIVELRNGDCRAVVSPAAGAVLSAEVRDELLLIPVKTPGLASQRHGREACFPLVPFGGRVEGNAFQFDGRHHLLAPNTEDPLVLHGDGWLREWDVAEVSEKHVDLTFEHQDNERSPYAYQAAQRIEISNNGLRLSLSVENQGRQALPFGIGFHPYLPATSDCTVQFDAGAYWTERQMHLPGEKRAMDTDNDFSQPRTVPDRWINSCYESWSGFASIRYSSGSMIRISADPLFNRLMVYKPAGRHDYLCLEPMSHRPNSHACPLLDGLVALPCGHRLSGSISIERVLIDDKVLTHNA
ncbi:aldose 1-epimerase [Oryzifoliimicrobium ureilyticus]|uniref:aldose 1-epimerase n=1 Tax=Oryzifoliimicrobium ureilyticus TaxID=3113724 RepID=UPI0030760806